MVVDNHLFVVCNLYSNRSELIHVYLRNTLNYISEGRVRGAVSEILLHPSHWYNLGKFKVIIIVCFYAVCGVLTVIGMGLSPFIRSVVCWFVLGYAVLCWVAYHSVCLSLILISL